MSTATPQKTATDAPDREYKSPVLKTTRFDRAWSFMISIVMALIITVFLLLLIWWSNRPVTGTNELIIISQASGGDPEGDDSPLEVISPDPPTDDPAVVDDPADVNEIAEVMESVLELSDNAALQVQQQLSTGAENKGTPGSREGSDKGPLGDGPGNGGGYGDRWFITFADNGSSSEYAAQLDFFKIEIGHFNPETQELAYVTNFSTTPRLRTEKPNKKDKRFFFLWQGGGRKQADERLLAKAGVNITRNSIIVHFYPSKVVGMLTKIERKNTKRNLKDVARTYFGVRPQGSGYKFIVTRMTYKN